MGLWLFVNLLIALVLPSFAVLLVVAIFNFKGGDLNLPRLVRDFQLCLACFGLAAGTIYDVIVALPDKEPQQVALGISLPVAVVAWSAIFYGVTLMAGQIKTSRHQDRALAIISVATLVMTVLFLVVARDKMGLFS